MVERPSAQCRSAAASTIQHQTGVDVEIYVENGVKMRITADDPDAADAAASMLADVTRSVLDDG